MKVCFVDTNIYLRFLRKDNPDQFKFADKLFTDAVFNKLKLRSSLIVFFEIYWVLKKLYGQMGEDLQNNLMGVLDLRVKFSKKKILKVAVQDMDKFEYDLEDAFNFYIAKEQDVDEFVTFDKKLQKKW